jgi:hypothetical protein
VQKVDDTVPVDIERRNIQILKIEPLFAPDTPHVHRLVAPEHMTIRMERIERDLLGNGRIRARHEHVRQAIGIDVDQVR